jgi:nucleolar pre-ribosomal-associated protein 1
MRRLNSYLGSGHNELILVTLKLLHRISIYAGGRERKTLLEQFSWETKVCSFEMKYEICLILTYFEKSLQKLLHMRRKGKNGEIRTLYLLLILSFVVADSPSAVKQAFLEQHKGVFLSIFKGLIQDPYNLVKHVLAVCWDGIWSDPKIKRTLKIGLFSEITIAQVRSPLHSFSLF